MRSYSDPSSSARLKILPGRNTATMQNISFFQRSKAGNNNASPSEIRTSMVVSKKRTYAAEKDRTSASRKRSATKLEDPVEAVTLETLIEAFRTKSMVVVEEMLRTVAMATDASPVTKVHRDAKKKLQEELQPQVTNEVALTPRTLETTKVTVKKSRMQVATDRPPQKLSPPQTTYVPSTSLALVAKRKFAYDETDNFVGEATDETPVKKARRRIGKQSQKASQQKKEPSISLPAHEQNVADEELYENVPTTADNPPVQKGSQNNQKKPRKVTHKSKISSKTSADDSPVVNSKFDGCGFWSEPLESCFESSSYKDQLKNSQFTEQQANIIQQSFHQLSRKLSSLYPNRNMIILPHETTKCGDSKPHQGVPIECRNYLPISGTNYNEQIEDLSNIDPDTMNKCKCPLSKMHSHAENRNRVSDAENVSAANSRRNPTKKLLSNLNGLNLKLNGIEFNMKQLRDLLSCTSKVGQCILHGMGQIRPCWHEHYTEEQIMQALDKQGLRENEFQPSQPVAEDISLSKALELSIWNHILELENYIFHGNLGAIKVKDREAWRSTIVLGGYDKQADFLSWGPRQQFTDDYQTNVFLNLPADSDSEKPETQIAKIKNSGAMGAKADIVRELAFALLQVSQGIHDKFIKRPLGLNEKERKEREARNKPLDLEARHRWEVSLMKCRSFEQVVLHLLALDSSMIWTSSIFNASCRICRGNADSDKMLLCDGCDQGHHLYCLKPKLNTLPVGDWFCNLCKPKERAPRKRMKYVAGHR